MDNPESEALLDKLYEEFLRETGLDAESWRMKTVFREKFKVQVRVYHAVQLGKILLEMGVPQNELVQIAMTRRGR